MKVTFNLATPPGWREQYGLAVAGVALAVGLGVLVGLGRSAVSNFRRERSVSAALAQAATRLDRLQKKESSLRSDLARPEFQNLISETAYLNGLIERKQFSAARLTARVSQLLPPDVRVDEMAFSAVAAEPAVRLSVEAKNEKAFESFLGRLEGSPDFSDVVVTSQGVADSSTNSSAILATCTAVYNGAGIVAEGQGMTDAETTPQDNSAVR